ncbi:hypothetical protein EDD37DRAFT_603787 [Exophiala viscosa]|uniref:ABM domain-containing protein n=1 Tax=Exophiala viscosa TaxID=2486360 RepID=A0AAN6IAH4_9EURO|nr:hypothetical protein EDD36DRAFT_322854 [Exophiala viscosa]KAI1628872.1 hypothetical protein EDD37DRAFT_603787 [Exophiala viscosa]
MAQASGQVLEHRNSVPIEHFLESKGPDGTLISMNVFVDPSKVDDFIKLITPTARKIREYKECLFCEVSVHPTDRGHLRVLHGWTKDSAWFRDNLETQTWFGDYVKALASIRDPNRHRQIQHFDLIPTH